MTLGKVAALKDTAALSASADRQREPGSQTSNPWSASEAEGRCVSIGVFRRCSLKAPCHPPSPRRKQSLNTHLESGQMKINY